MRAEDYYKVTITGWKGLARNGTDSERLLAIRTACFQHQRLRKLEGKACQNSQLPVLYDRTPACRKHMASSRLPGSVKTRKKWGYYSLERELFDREWRRYYATITEGDHG